MRYTIRKGRHYSTSTAGRALRAVTGINLTGYLGGMVTFGEGCLKADASIHKLFGLSDEVDHHCCSARYGWSPSLVMENTIDIYAYSYFRKERDHDHVCSVAIGEAVALQLVRLRGEWTFAHYSDPLQVNDLTSTEAELTRPLFYHTLYPYHGGQHVAPADMDITIDWF